MVHSERYKRSDEGMEHMVEGADKRFCIFIGGVPGVGKSSISAHIASKLRIGNVLSGDYLREFFRAYHPDDRVMAMSVYDAWQLFGEKNRGNIVKGFREQASLMVPGISRIIERSDRNGELTIVETLYFLPSLYSKILDRTIPIYLFVSDGDIHSSKLMERTKYTHLRSPGERLSSHLWEYRIMMEESLEECRKFGILKVDTVNFESALKQVMEFIGDEIELRR